MSSPKKIGRWNRFEIAFAQGNWAETPSFREKQGSTPDKIRDARKMEKETPNDASLVEPASSEETTSSESETASRTASPSLWVEARREAETAKKRRTRR